ncbi:MAG TPA: alpha-1,4-glucan--maltose-1-phosphate maltosyltransferase [Steroidobacteraceae bacterium]|jgi:starch synthase (maltosyl-transferring)
MSSATGLRAAGVEKAALNGALEAPRIRIEHVSPSVDHGALPAKGLVGQAITVEADIYMDGHDQVAARLIWRGPGSLEEHSVPMQPLGNDRWRAEFTPGRSGRHRFNVEAWFDEWGSYQRDLEKKRLAGVPEAVDIEEGRRRLVAATERAPARARESMPEAAPFLARLEQAEQASAVELLLSEQATLLMTQIEPRSFVTHLPLDLIMDVERIAAGFASWYELFPRSQSPLPGRHGSFDDVIARLPAIRAMGFDVLYMTPIHPIGRSHRKGRNNSLEAAPDDPGSPYAIGSAEGGHTALHSQLGDMAAFRRLVAAAKEQGMEIALDFAIQCSRDHPWLTEHPEWFSWRADGSVRYAENPPKKYQDIVNVDFYAERARPGLWVALRDVLLYWIDAGVRTFRVDNPHTKPLPFWRWLIADIRSRHPDVVFLSEAFTRPSLMYRLAKLGFTQSYTYFIWRNSKRELSEYFTELADGEPRDFFRPNLFVNTPDINPLFLQTSGRPGFLIRAALAATLSGLWGLYSGFELCESAPLPGREEYLDSEKYELRQRDWQAPGNIIAEITQLNRIRHENRALQSHRGLRFYSAVNEQVLWFGKFTPDLDNFILVAVSLDPHNVQETQLEVPLWEFGLNDNGVFAVEELMRGVQFKWYGKIQQWRFVPWELPFAIFRVRPWQSPA